MDKNGVIEFLKRWAEWNMVEGHHPLNLCSGLQPIFMLMEDVFKLEEH